MEIERMWHLKPTHIPIVVGALGTVKKRYKRIFAKHLGKPSLTETQKILLTNTANI